MIESSIKIGGIELPALLVLGVTSIFMILGIFWFLRRGESDEEVRDEDTFDIALFGLIMGLFFARLLGLLVALTEYSDLGWSINPLNDATGDFAPLSAFPWIFLKIWDGNIYYSVIAFGALIGAWITASSKRRVKDLRGLLDKFTIAFVVGQAILIVGTFITSAYVGKEYSGPFALNYGGEAGRFPIQLFEVIALIVVVVLMNMESIKSRKGAKAGIYLLIWGAVQFGLRFMSSDYDSSYASFDYGHFVSIVLILFSLVFLLEGRKPGQVDMTEREKMIKRSEAMDMSQDTQRSGYSVSYGAGRGNRSEQSSGVLSELFRKRRR